MRPTLLKPNQPVIVRDGFGGDRQMIFIRREKQPCRSAINYFQCDEYRGLYGAGDQGICTMNDARVVKIVFRPDNFARGQLLGRPNTDQSGKETRAEANRTSEMAHGGAK